MLCALSIIGKCLFDFLLLYGNHYWCVGMLYGILVGYQKKEYLSRRSGMPTPTTAWCLSKKTARISLPNINEWLVQKIVSDSLVSISYLVWFYYRFGCGYCKEHYAKFKYDRWYNTALRGDAIHLKMTPTSPVTGHPVTSPSCRWSSTSLLIFSWILFRSFPLW